MSSLMDRLPKDSFMELLKFSVDGQGVGSSLTTLQDGYGNNTPLQLSATQIGLNGMIWPTAIGTNGQFLTTNASGTLSWATVAVPTKVSQLTNDSGFIGASGLATYAPLAAPALTGIPTAPTASANTNTTQLATTAFVLGQASSTTPTMAGTAAIGTATTFARADHTHPVDTSRAAAASPTITGRTQSDAYSYTVVNLGTIAANGTATINMTAGSEFTMTLSGITNVTINGNPAATAGQVIYVRITNGAAGNINWPTGMKYAGGTAPSYTTGTDLVGILYDMVTNDHMLFVIGQNIQ